LIKLHLPRIYPITDKALAGRPTHYSILKELIRGGAGLVQIRDKQTPLRELLLDLLRCVELADRHRVLLIINDRCDLALSSGATGVHLGHEDLPPEAARKVLGPQQVIGYSTHSIRQVRQALSLPVDYIGFGPVYATSTKQSPWPVVGPEELSRACRDSVKPVVAIGGIGPEQIPEVLEAGAASAAVISALMTAPNLARKMEELLRRATGRELTGSWMDMPQARDRVRH
jgi:thiamine-phosphate pyrophosphorylase